MICSYIFLRSCIIYLQVIFLPVVKSMIPSLSLSWTCVHYPFPVGLPHCPRLPAIKGYTPYTRFQKLCPNLHVC